DGGLALQGSTSETTRLVMYGGTLVTPEAVISGPARDPTEPETTLLLDEGAILESTGSVVIGAEANEAGHVLVLSGIEPGTISAATSDRLSVGYAGRGTLSIGGGGGVGGWHARLIDVGSLAGSSGRVDVYGAELG